MSHIATGGARRIDAYVCKDDCEYEVHFEPDARSLLIGGTTDVYKRVWLSALAVMVAAYVPWWLG